MDEILNPVVETPVEVPADVVSNDPAPEVGPVTEDQVVTPVVEEAVV